MDLRRFGKFTLIGNTTNTRVGFKHHAILFKKNSEISSASASYTNRTYEDYQYQTVYLMAIDKAHKNHFISDDDYKYITDKIKNEYGAGWVYEDTDSVIVEGGD